MSEIKKKIIGEKVEKVSRSIINQADVCLFCTIDEKGYPRARYMGAFVFDEDFIIYLACLAGSNKVKEIMNNKRAQVLFSDGNNQQVVTLTGSADLEKKYGKRKEIYDEVSPLELFKEFSDDFGVIKFRTKRLEYLNLKISNSSFSMPL